jgi:probable F420-dependent oxidoreductase
MSNRIEVSLGLWQDRPPEEVITTGRLADSLGYPAVWIGEMATWDAFALATHLGRDFTSARIVLGPLAVSVRDPAMIAMGAASVAALTGREVAVALGTSSPMVVEAWHGRDRSRSAVELAESAQIMRTLLDGGRGDLDGSAITMKGYRLRLPAPRCEIVMAAFGPGAIRSAARFADRMVLNLLDPDSVAALVARLRSASAEAGRRCPRVAVWTCTAVDPGPAALEQLRRGVVGYLGAPGYRDMFTRAGFGELVAFAATRPHPRDLLAAVPIELVQAVGAVGDQAGVAERIAAYHAAGADDVVIVPSATDDDPGAARTLRAVAELHGAAG